MNGDVSFVFLIAHNIGSLLNYQRVIKWFQFNQKLTRDEHYSFSTMYTWLAAIYFLYWAYDACSISIMEVLSQAITLPQHLILMIWSLVKSFIRSCNPNCNCNACVTLPSERILLTIFVHHTARKYLTLNEFKPRIVVLKSTFRAIFYVSTKICVVLITGLLLLWAGWNLPSSTSDL